MSSTRLLKRWISRAFLRPSHHYIACRKEELLVGTPWGKVQLWREYSHPGDARPARVYFLRFLGSRGRAEPATLDPADRLDGVPGEVWTVNPPAFGGTTGPAELDRYADCALAALDYLVDRAPGVPVWLCGKSIGTAAALLAAAHGGAAGVILRNVMPLRELLSRHYGWRTGGLSRLLLAPAVPERLDCLANADSHDACPLRHVAGRSRFAAAIPAASNRRLSRTRHGTGSRGRARRPASAVRRRSSL
jgi:pimeloyl-ACP methyl ester carboxylesterase